MQYRKSNGEKAGHALVGPEAIESRLARPPTQCLGRDDYSIGPAVNGLGQPPEGRLSKSSIAIDNMRGFVVVMVVAFHSSMAYLTSQPATEPPFDSPPYVWLANPIVDNVRWLPLDLFSASQFLYLMQLLFFVSGVFVWPSLMRKGAARFLRDRALRLGILFVFGTALLMPATYYAVFRITATDPGVFAFWRHWLALPFWPSGPMWFLWFLLVLDVMAAALYLFGRRSVEALARLGTTAHAYPGRCFIVLSVISALTYMPLARIYTPWQWVEFGPFAFQPGLALQYVVYFFAGMIVGAGWLERGMLGSGGALARRAGGWIAAALALFVAWLAAMAIAVKGPAPPPAAVQIAADITTVLFVATACFAAVAGFIRFANRRQAICQSLGENGCGVYFFHYFFVLWAQYFLLGIAMFALVKAAVVFSVALFLSWAANAAVCRTSIGARLLRGTRRRPPLDPVSSAAGGHGLDRLQRAHS